MTVRFFFFCTKNVLSLLLTFKKHRLYINDGCGHYRCCGCGHHLYTMMSKTDVMSKNSEGLLDKIIWVYLFNYFLS